jgi:drug/metabolite transporter (DMT)-like permease
VPSRRGLGLLAGLGAAAIWGGMYVVSKYVLDHVPPFTLVWLRLAIGAVALAAVALVVRSGARAPERERTIGARGLAFMALLGAVGMFGSMNAQFLGTKLSTAANGALITSATPAFMVLFARPILGERLTAWRVVGLLAATAGVVVTIVLDPSFRGLGGGRLGNALLVAAALTWALYSVLAGLAARSRPALVTTLYATAFGALFTLPLVDLGFEPPPALAWLGVLYLGVVSTAVAFYLWNRSIQLLGAGLPAVLFFAQPVVGGALGALLLGERLGAGFFLGGALIVAGVLVTALKSP